MPIHAAQIQLVERTAREDGFTHLTLDVRATQTAAIQLYESLGYECWGINPNYATVGGKLVAGRYYLEISGVGRGDPLGDGYTDYASIGQYYISGTVPPDVTSTAAPTAPADACSGP